MSLSGQAGQYGHPTSSLATTTFAVACCTAGLPPPVTLAGTQGGTQATIRFTAVPWYATGIAARVRVWNNYNPTGTGAIEETLPSPGAPNAGIIPEGEGLLMRVASAAVAGERVGALEMRCAAVTSTRLR